MHLILQKSFVVLVSLWRASVVTDSSRLIRLTNIGYNG